MTERLIERGFPIVQLNPLSVRERNAFKPVYKMHKWFARRSSSIFRAILLGAALPAEDGGHATDLMQEFYRGHRDDPRLRRADGSPLRVVDPFMGGGTTIVEGLRLGFEVTGYDLNPIAWFIVRGETTPVDLDALDAAYQRVEAKVRDELLELYKTTCPLTGKPADVIYAFWVKQGICIDPSCRATTDLFKTYEIACKRGDATLRYIPDVNCPHCSNVFDWELDRCTVTANGPQVLGEESAGKGRPPRTLFAFGRLQDGVTCPHCGEKLDGTGPAIKSAKTKSVPLRVLLDPSTGDFFEVRGGVPETVTAPASGLSFRSEQGPVTGSGKFACSGCGRQQAIVEAADAYQRPLPFRCYGFYAHTPFADESREHAERLGLPTNNNKWFAASSGEDLARLKSIESALSAVRKTLPLPTQEIPEGRNFRDLRRQGYACWTDMFPSRQLLALGKLLAAIMEEPEPKLREALLGAFQSHVDNTSHLCKLQVNRNQLTNVTGGHDFRNPTTTAENNVWGVGGQGQGTFSNCFAKYREGQVYLRVLDVSGPDGEALVPGDCDVATWAPSCNVGNAKSLPLQTGSIDLVVTDPPYAGSVQYAEMSDWSYVWLSQALRGSYPDAFGPDLTLKAEEIVEDGNHKDSSHFFEALTAAWRECHRILADDGLLAFTFHHREGDRWTGLLRSLFDAGFYLVAAYPTHSEALNSIVIQATKGITYDIIHVCRKRVGQTEPIAWSRLRREVTRAAREQLREIEQGKDVLPGPDVQMILLGKALMLFSRHHEKVLDADGEPMALEEAMERILVLVREVRGEELPLPGSLQDLDSLTQLALLHVVGKGPWARDDLHKELRGYTHGPASLLEAGLVREVKGQKARIEAVPALERVAASRISSRREGPMIDKLHLLLTTVSEGRSIDKLLKEWRGRWETITEALGWLAKADASVKELAALTIRQIGALGPDLGPQAITEQLKLSLGQ